MNVHKGDRVMASKIALALLTSVAVAATCISSGASAGPGGGGGHGGGGGGFHGGGGGGGFHGGGGGGWEAFTLAAEAFTLAAEAFTHLPPTPVAFTDLRPAVSATVLRVTTPEVAPSHRMLLWVAPSPPTAMPGCSPPVMA